VKSLLVLLLGLIVLSTASLSELQSSFYMPLMAWSNSGYFQAPNTYVNEAVDLSFIPTTFKSLLNPTLPVDAPEVVVVFLASTLRSDLFRQYTFNGQVDNLQAFVYKSQSSLVSPFVTAAATKSSVGQLLAAAAASSKSLFVSTLQDQTPWTDAATVLSIEQLKETLEQQSAMFSNQQTEVIFIYFDDSQEIATIDATVGEINELIASKTPKFAALFTGDLPTPSQVQTAFFEPQPKTLRRLELAGDGTSNSTYPNRWPAGVVQGVFNGALLIFFLLFGIVVTSCIQTPDRFEGGQNPQRQH